MRFVLMACVLLAACSGVLNAQEEKPALMKGVKIATKCYFSMDVEAATGRGETLRTKWITEYNVQGDPVKVTTEHGGVKFVDSWVYAYDEKGQKQSCLFLSSAGQKEKSTFAYQADGSYVKLSILYAGEAGKEKPIRASTSEYNAKGQLTSEAYNNANGPAVPRTVYVYDTKNRLAEKKVFVESSPFPEVTTYTYDGWEERDMTEITRSPEGTILEKIVRARNERGDPLYTRYYGADDKARDLIKREYVYDADGRFLIKNEERSWNSEDTLALRRWTYQYEFYEKK